MHSEKPKLWSFLAWPVVGAALSLSVLGALTIGAYVMPFALVGLFILLKWGGDRRSCVGLISGLGLPLLYVAFLNRDGPGTICSSYGNGGQRCVDEWSPLDSMAMASHRIGAPGHGHCALFATAESSRLKECV